MNRIHRGRALNIACALVGPPGAGKGTQARLLESRTDRVALSTGDLLRAEMQAETAVGLAVTRYVTQGLLVPDALVLRVLYQGMLEAGDDAPGLVLDGYPRSVRQALALDRLLEPARLGVVIELALPRDSAIERLRARDRADDGASTVARRFEVYASTTVPMLAFHRRSGRLVTLNADQRVDTLHEQIATMLQARRNERFSDQAALL